MENTFRFRSDSQIERMITDRAFAYHRPWFYNHPYALRCELGVGKSTRAYLHNARQRAFAIFDLLFPRLPDAIFFDYYVIDYSSWVDEIDVRRTLRGVKKELQFLSAHSDYESTVLFNIPRDEGERETTLQKNRIICYPGERYPYKKRISECFSWTNRTIHFVSFENECIMSIYDDRGCDIVFATKEKMQAFFGKLEPYVLAYDMEEMKKRIK